MGLRPTKGHEDDAGKSVGKRKRLPHVGPSGAGASACQPASSTKSLLFWVPAMPGQEVPMGLPPTSVRTLRNTCERGAQIACATRRL